MANGLLSELKSNSLSLEYVQARSRGFERSGALPNVEKVELELANNELAGASICVRMK